MGEEGAAWVTSAHRAIQALNEKYGGGFYLFFRRPGLQCPGREVYGLGEKKGGPHRTGPSAEKEADRPRTEVGEEDWLREVTICHYTGRRHQPERRHRP